MKQPILTAEQRQELKTRAIECGLDNKGYRKCPECGIWMGLKDSASWCCTVSARDGMCPLTDKYLPPSKIQRYEPEE